MDLISNLSRLLSFTQISQAFSPKLSPLPLIYQGISVWCVRAEWSLVSVYRGKSPASWQVMCDVQRCGLPLRDPCGRVVEAQQPPSPGGPQRPQRALGRWSLQHLSSLFHELRGGGANTGGGTGPGSLHRCQGKAETLTRPCWEGAGPEQVQSQPLYPLCQHLSGGACALFLSSFLLIHTLKRCCGTSSSPSHHPATNPDTKKLHPDTVQQ